MPSFQINDDEREALRGLPMLAREIYVFGLRPFMDYATGVVGIKRGVSWKSIAEELYVEPHQGIKGGEPTEKELRRALVWLQKVGLLSPNRADRKLVFELLLATRDKSARNKVGTKWADEAGSYVAGAEPSSDAGLPEEEGGEVAGGDSPKVGTPPESGINPTAHTAREGLAALLRFPMHDGWEPDRKTFMAVLARNGLANVRPHPDQFLEFRSYWIARPDKHQTQAQWEHQLAQQLKRTTRIQQSRPEGPSYETGGRTPARRTRSAVDILNDDNW